MFYMWVIYVHVCAFLSMRIFAQSTKCCLYINIFRVDPYVLNKQLVYSHLGSTMSSALSIPYLPVFLCPGLRPREPSLIHSSLLLVSSFFRSC